MVTCQIISLTLSTLTQPYCLIDESDTTVAPAAAALDACHSEAITVRLFFEHHSPQLTYPQHPPLRWIVVLSLGCARNINKDGAHFKARVRSWRSYGKIEDCKQSTFEMTDADRCLFHVTLQAAQAKGAYSACSA